MRRAHGHSPTWGDGNVKYDWAKAAEKAGNLVLSVNENLLIIVEGSENYITESQLNFIWWKT